MPLSGSWLDTRVPVACMRSKRLALLLALSMQHV